MGKVYLTPSEARAVFDAVPLVGGKPSDDAALLHAVEDIIAARLEKVEALIEHIGHPAEHDNMKCLRCAFDAALPPDPSAAQFTFTPVAFNRERLP